MLDLNVATRAKLAVLGEVGDQWVADLPALVDSLSSDWSLVLEHGFEHGSSGLVAAVVADGRPAVLKVAIPPGADGPMAFDLELAAVLAGQGRGYVEVFAHDLNRRAALYERLGPSLFDAALPVEDQLAVLGSTVAGTWAAPPADAPWRTGVTQAEFLIDFIPRTWEASGRPCSAKVVDWALAHARRRRASVEAAMADGRHVVVHGDAHEQNTLTTLDGTAWRLIDPDPMVSEPAHDLGVIARGFPDELTAAGDPAALGRTWCELLAGIGGVDVEEVWQWACVERVSTGLYCCSLGLADGQAYLDVAERWCAAES